FLSCLLFFFFSTSLPLTSPLFPYTTLFRSLCPVFEPRELRLRFPGKATGETTASPLPSTLLFPWIRLPKQSTAGRIPDTSPPSRSEEHTSELQSRRDLVCRLLLEKKKT